MKTVFTLLSLFFAVNLFAAAPIAEYRMDECRWSGMPGEVEDSLGGDNNGTVTGSGADTTEGGVLCRAGIFSGDAVDINDLNVSTANGEKTTVMFWMYWDGTNSVMPFGWNIYDLWFYGGSFGFNTGNGDIYGISSSGLSGGWHHVVAVFTNGNVQANRLYIDGAEQTLTQRRNSPNNSRAVVQSSARIGGWLRNGGYRFRGDIDELKIYNGEVLGADIKSIYDNESAGKNYDGTQRECKCIMPVGEWRMDECSWSGAADEVLDNSGNGLDGTALNGASTLAAKLCMGGSFDGIDDAVRIADSDLLDGTQALTLMGWIKPQQLYQTNGSNARGFLSKRRSAGTDESYGIFFWNDHQMVDDDGDGDPDRAKLYIDIDGNNDRFSTNGYVGKSVWTHIAVVYDGNRSAASRVEVYINGQLDKTAAESSSTLPNYASDLYIGDLHYPDQFKVFDGLIDEVKVFNKALSGERVLAIYNNESAGKNLDGSQRICTDCPQPPLYKNGTFNAVDYAAVCDAVSNWEDNITTKVAGSAYSLSILSKDEATGLPMEANITRVDLYRYSSGDTATCSGIPYSAATLCSGGCGFTDAAGCMRLDVPSSSNDRAAKCVEVHIEGKDVNDTASVSLKESNSSDDFAVRPDRILFLQPAAEANLTAERTYLFASALNAVLSDGVTAAYDYNITLTPAGIKYMRSGEQNSSLAGTLSSAPSTFADGSADLNVSFSDVAIVSIRFNDMGWASVDSDDTPPQSRRVYGERNVTFIPKRFALQFLSAPAMEDNNTANRFTYISNDLNMSAWARNLTVVVTAVGEKNSTMRNFSNPTDRLFADLVDISPLLSLPAKYSAADYTAAPSAQSGANIGFDSGEAFVNYADVPFNYDRSFNTPLDPFFVSGSEANISVAVTDSRYPAVTGSIFSVFDGNATFYYGRLRADDVITTQPSVKKSVEIEVYDSSGSALVSGFRQNSLRWFRNEKHTGPSSGKIVDANVTLGLSLDSGSDTAVSTDYSTFGNGFVVMEINNTSGLRKSRTVHMGIDSWLWYAPRGFGLPYSYAASSDCASHPCFLYRYEVKGGATGVQSGDFNGSDFDTEPIDANATIRRKEGVKLFR